MYARLRRRVKAGVFKALFGTDTDRDLRTVMLDGTYVKLHQLFSGARSNGAGPETSQVNQKIGRSRCVY